MITEFWSRVDKHGAVPPACPELGACWLWQGEPDRYGNFKGEYAHRVAWELENGSIPAGMFVLHRCDVMRCVRPTHLRLGTARENAHDMYRRQRARNPASLELSIAIAPSSSTLPMFQDAPTHDGRAPGRPRASHVGVCRVCSRRVRVHRGVAVPHGWLVSDTLPLFGPRCFGSLQPARDVRALERAS